MEDSLHYEAEKKPLEILPQELGKSKPGLSVAFLLMPSIYSVRSKAEELICKGEHFYFCMAFQSGYF